MDYAVIQNDLKNQEIHPKKLTDQYISLLAEDIKQFFAEKQLHPYYCPSNGETFVTRVFSKMGFQYLKSKSFGNIYLSPRPSHEDLLRFYRNSTAREFWYKNLLKQTETSRKEKILDTHLNWLHATAVEHGFRSQRKIVELNPIIWSYCTLFREAGYGDSYTMLDPLFSPAWVTDESARSAISGDTSKTYDIACLWGALNRSPDPRATLKRVHNLLGRRGLCFVTEVLSSGFEIQTLAENSSIILPPEKMNLFSYEGLEAIVQECGFQILEFSTPGLLDMENVLEYVALSDGSQFGFAEYVAKFRNSPELLTDFQQFLQIHKLSSIARLVLIKE